MSTVINKIKTNKYVKGIAKLGALYIVLEVVAALGVVYWASSSL